MAKVYPPLAQLDEDPPCGDANVRCAMVNAQYCWEFSRANCNELPVPLCGSGNTSGLPQCTLVVWTYYPGASDYTSNSITFRALCSDHTNCDVSGSGIAAPTHRVERSDLDLPETLTATLTQRAGEFADLPERVVLKREAGRSQWSWHCSRVAGRDLTLVADDHAGLRVFWLRGASYDPALVPPQPGSSLRPLMLIFAPVARGGRGSFTVTITE
jgi:hypothetical protein